MAGATCSKKVLCCSQAQALGEAIDTTFEALFENHPEAADDAALYAILEEDIDEVIKIQLRCLKRLGKWISERRKS